MHYIQITVEYSKEYFSEHKYLFEYSFWLNKYFYFITNIHCKYSHEYSHDIRPGYQGNALGMDKEV